MTSAPFPRRVVVTGEALVDIVVPLEGDVEHAPGGSPLNVAVGLSRLGFDTLLVTQLGEDEHGRLVAEHVRASGVALHERSVLPGRRTSTATARLDEYRAATYEFDLDWSLEPVPLPADAAALHVGSIGAALRPGREAVLAQVREAAERGLAVSFDPNVRPAFQPDPEQAWHDVVEIAASSRVVKMSDEDAEYLRPGVEHAAVAADLLAGGSELVVFTRGGEGSSGYTRQREVHIPSPRTDVADTVGAGDSFMAALLAVLLEHGLEADLEGALTAAAEAAAITVSRRGANPPWRRELGEDWPRLT